MNKITGYRKGFSGQTKAKDLDLASAINNTYYEYADKEYLTPKFKDLLNNSKVILGSEISKRDNQNYLNDLKTYRKDNYNSLWYESGWLKTYRASGLKIKFAKTYYPLDKDPYTTVNGQAYCLDRTIRANFEPDAGFPYGKEDGFGYPEGISSGQRFKICGFVRNDLPWAPFISPYKNIFELVDHSGYQLGSVGRNYWTKKELLNFGLSEYYADAQTSGIISGTKTGQLISYNKIYFQDNIPNIEWCVTNRCSFVYTEMRGERNLQYDDPIKVKSSDETIRRIFVFSGTVSWIPTGTSPNSFDLGYGPYFQPNNTGLYKLYNNNYTINQSGTLNDREVYSFSVFNTGDLPKNFYISSASSNLEVIDDKFKITQFVYPNNHPLSGQLVKYYTIGKNSSVDINFRINYLKTGTHSSTLANGTKIYTNTGGLILNEVTGTMLEDGKLSFLVKSKLISASTKALGNNTKIFFDDYYFSSFRENQLGVIQGTGDNLEYNLEGSLLKYDNNGNLPTSSPVFGLTAYATGLNIISETSTLKAKFASKTKALPSYQGQANITVNVEPDTYVSNLNTERQYFKYREGYSGLFKNQNGQLVYQKNNFNPITGAVQLDLLFKLQRNNLPTFNTEDSKQEYVSVNFLSGSGYRFYDTVSNKYKKLDEIILKKGLKYNFLQTNLSHHRPLAIKGDVSGLKVIEPNYNKINGNYRLIQFSVKENNIDPSIEYFSVSPNSITGKMMISGDNLREQSLNLVLRTKVFSQFDIPQERSGAKVYYRFQNQRYPELYLETDKTYDLLLPISYTGFYFYTGNNIYGSGRNPYLGSAISETLKSGVLVNPETFEITGYTSASVKTFKISAAHIPDNLYYGDKYSAYAGNKINKISPYSPQNLNKFKEYNVPICTGLISFKTSDDSKEDISIKYNLVQNTGNIPRV